MLARQIYDEQLPLISKVLSAAIVGLLHLYARQIAVSTWQCSDSCSCAAKVCL